MIKCFSCGTEYEDELNYCPNCGATNKQHLIVVIGVDAEDNGDLKYYPCDDENIKIGDKVYLNDEIGTCYAVKDVKKVSIETTEVYIDNTIHAQKVKLFNVDNNDPNIVTRQIFFNEGYSVVAYHLDNKEEIKSYDAEFNLKAVGATCKVLAIVGGFATFILGVFVGFLFLFVFGGDSAYKMYILKIWLWVFLGTLLFNTFCELTKEERRINDFKYFIYDIKRRGGEIVLCDMKRLTLEYKYNGKTTYVSPSMKNRKVFAKKLF